MASKHRDIIAFVDNEPNLKIRNGKVYWPAHGGGEESLRCMPLNTFRRWMDSANALLEEWDRRCEKPLAFTKRG